MASPRRNAGRFGGAGILPDCGVVMGRDVVSERVGLPERDIVSQSVGLPPRPPVVT
jgi:hypothetical protein